MNLDEFCETSYQSIWPPTVLYWPAMIWKILMCDLSEDCVNEAEDRTGIRVQSSLKQFLGLQHSRNVLPL